MLHVTCYKNQKGQSLLETVVALGILMSGLVGVFTLVIGNLNAERAGAMRIQALNLAREGIEAVKNIRDSNWLQGKETWQGLSSGDFELIFNPTIGEKILQNIDDTSLYASTEEGSSGLYLQGQGIVGDKTPFSRLISLSAIVCSQDLRLDLLCTNPNAVIGYKVNSKVEWFEAGRRHEVSLIEKLYDWR